MNHLFLTQNENRFLFFLCLFLIMAFFSVTCCLFATTFNKPYCTQTYVSLKEKCKIFAKSFLTHVFVKTTLTSFFASLSGAPRITACFYGTWQSSSICLLTSQKLFSFTDFRETRKAISNCTANVQNKPQPIVPVFCLFQTVAFIQKTLGL